MRLYISEKTSYRSKTGSNWHRRNTINSAFANGTTCNLQMPCRHGATRSIQHDGINDLRRSGYVEDNALAASSRWTQDTGTASSGKRFPIPFVSFPTVVLAVTRKNGDMWEERGRASEAGGMASGLLNATESQKVKTNDRWAMPAFCARHCQSNSAMLR